MNSLADGKNMHEMEWREAGGSGGKNGGGGFGGGRGGGGGGGGGGERAGRVQENNRPLLPNPFVSTVLIPALPTATPPPPDLALHPTHPHHPLPSTQALPINPTPPPVCVQWAPSA
ncbi:unnamed protein product [Arctogadus glacialis]